MDFLRNIGETVNSAVDFVVEKNRKFTKINRLNKLIKRESDSIIRSYIALGKHYYSDLRDVPNKEMQKVCNNIDMSKQEIKKLKKHLIDINNEQSYTKFRNLVDEEPVDIELYSDDKNGSECNCNDEKDGICKCELNDSGTCDCVDTFKKSDEPLQNEKFVEKKSTTRGKNK